MRGAAGRFSHEDFRIAIEPRHAFMLFDGNPDVRLHVHPGDVCLPAILSTVINPPWANTVIDGVEAEESVVVAGLHGC